MRVRIRSFHTSKIYRMASTLTWARPLTLWLYASFFLMLGTQASAQDARLSALSLEQALATALAGNANILLSRAQADLAQSVVQQNKGLFDVTLNAQSGNTRNVRPLNQGERASYLLGGYDLRDQLTDTTITQVGATQLFSSGIQANLVASYTSTNDSTFVSSGTPRQSIGALTFQLRVPLLRNAGDVNSARIRAAEIVATAARSELEFAVSQTLLNSTLNYWDYLAKGQILVISLESEHRGEAQLEEIRTLIAANELPRAEINLAQATLNDRRSARIDAEQVLLESRRTLGRALGLNAQASMAIGELADAFPRYDGITIHTVTKAAAMTAQAMQTRSDLAALRQRKAAGQILLEVALKNEQPQFDLVLGTTKTGLREGGSIDSIGAAFTQNQGTGYSANLFFQMPLGNNSARGLYQQREAELDTQLIKINELNQTISNNVETAAYAVLRASKRLTATDAATKTYAVSLENERTKRRLGMATLIDSLNIEDRYNNSLLASVQAHQAYANAIAQFRFETGSLLTREGTTYRANVGELLTPRLH
jgi:outer membrane protein TolC